MSAELRYRVDDAEHEPELTRCKGCDKWLTVRPIGSKYRRQLAFSEDTDTFGRRRYWCRACTMAIYARM